MLIVDKRKETPVSTIRAHNIPIGTIFTGVINIRSQIFLRIYSGLVDLAEPRNTWDMLDFDINNYQPLNVTLIIEGNIPYPQNEEDEGYRV